MTDESATRSEKLPTSAPVAAPTPQEQPKPSWWQIAGNFAQISSAVIAFIGLGLILVQVTALKNNAERASLAARESGARQLYQSYMELTHRYPEFVKPDLDAIKKDALLTTRYEQFVAHMMFAYDEVLAVIDAPEWRASFMLDSRAHLEYLCNEN
jgi:hypothetical protein